MTRLDPACQEFRDRLSRALEGPPRPDELAPLGWSHHLGSCSACRALLAREEALEELLASLPRPQLSPERRRALLACLRAEARGESALDHLLERDASVLAPAGLADRVRAGLDDARLDALLDRDRDLAPPAGLAARVLEGLADERAPAPLAGPGSSGFRRWLLPAAAAAAVLAVSLQLARNDEPTEPEPVVAVGPDGAQGRGPDAPDPVDQGLAAGAGDAVAAEDDLLAVLDLLEEDALWSEESLDLALASELEIAEEWLLEFTLEESEGDAAGADSSADEGDAR